MEEFKMDEHGALSVLNSVVNHCLDQDCLAGTVMEDVNFDEVFRILENAIGLLDDFKLWLSLDPVTKLRGKNKLSYLSDYYHKLHEADEE